MVPGGDASGSDGSDSALDATESTPDAADSAPDGSDSVPDAAVLFSAGKDSTLAALLLEPFYDVTLVHATFGVGVGVSVGDCDGPAEAAPRPVETARGAAAAVDRPFASIELDRAVAEAAVDRMVADGYPREGIQLVHERALEAVAAAGADRGWDVVADGTRRDDRVPTVDRPFAQSLEDRFGVDHVAPLAGYGRGAVDALADRRLRIETGPSEALATADYETELRQLLVDERGPDAVDRIFPEHAQSRVVGRR